ncbi:transcription factor SOX-14 [Schistosoma japonicum]|nr:transcription factor SOX-14 [Schistosoma japonicum]
MLGCLFLSVELVYFSLFAQHIRRNVLRVFSDASNSVISQQLGDLWRTVPRSCRNQYDDEANRLVKIHQIEFPNYKYQPKKRQIMTSTNSDHLRTTTLNQNHDNTIHIHTQSSGLSVNKREDQLTTNKLLSSSLLRTSTDYNVYSTTVTNKLPSSIRNCSVPSTLSINNSSVRKQVNNMIDVNSQRNGSTDLMNTLVTSPSKLPCNTVYTKLEPKSLNVNTISNNNSGSNITTNNTTNGSQTMSFKSTSHGSLSSVLPPLLTLSHNHPHYNQQQQQQQQHTSVLIEQIPIGICDSAYASGINSSSSSSASSPAVGELISPAKSCSSTFSSSLCMKQNKTSPVRRKIHFIPIRPQSQQLPPVGSQPTRQRFLSANNGNNNNGVPTGGCIQSNGFQFKSNSESVLPSRITNDLHIQQQQQQLKEEMNETILLQDSEMLATTTDILTPVYIQLDNEGQSPTEGLMFTLPPGTALIQTCNDNIGRTFQTNVEVEGEDEEEVEEEHGKHCIDNDFDNELTHQSLQLVSYSNNNNNDNNNNNHHDNHLIKIDEFNDSCHEIIDSGTSIESSFINNDNQSQLYKVIRSDIDFINNQYPTSRLVTSLHKVHKYSSPTSIQTSIKSTSSLRMNSLHELLTNTPQVYSSTLADLDSLDKSSLFIIKPEWSVLA